MIFIPPPVIIRHNDSGDKDPNDGDIGIFFILLTTSFMLYKSLFFMGVLFNLDNSKYKCQAPIKRYEYVFPVRIIGCWLGHETKKSINE